MDVRDMASARRRANRWRPRDAASIDGVRATTIDPRTVRRKHASPAVRFRAREPYADRGERSAHDARRAARGGGPDHEWC